MSQDLINELIQNNPVVVFSKTYCGFCSSTKRLLASKNVNAKILELDNRSDGGSIQGELARMTGQRTVPSIFIGGNFVGGDSDLQRENRNGNLDSMLTAAGAL
eukprot:TRINITY_DN590_c0_g1_i1.p1 TRINITY_DN590_c0_g1~~TRINITY_DN590_c0_g1_i1.p1  ORF type:complete len:103 (-),score=24.94 TRINITY_DN590_c0_g1_i1:53-361(-)